MSTTLTPKTGQVAAQVQDTYIGTGKLPGDPYRPGFADKYPCATYQVLDVNAPSAIPIAVVCADTVPNTVKSDVTYNGKLVVTATATAVADAPA